MTQTKVSLNEMGGSFLNNKQQKELSEIVEGRHESFSEVVEKQKKEIKQRGLQKKKDEIIEPDGGVRLTHDDITGGEDLRRYNESQQEAENKYKQRLSDQEEISFETKNENGDTVCRYCKSIIKSNKPSMLLDITDDELTTYLFGGRISRKFTIGNSSFEVVSLLQNEVDDVSFRAGRDMDRGEITLESDYRTRHSLYRLIYALSYVQNSKITPDPPRNASQSDMEEWFSKKYSIVSSCSHQFIVVVSDKQAILESSIAFAIKDQIRLKN